MVGIKRLAQHLDISIGTVSRALNGRPDVSEDTRRRVMEAAATLGYTPNQSGRSLRKGATGVIAAMIPASEDTPLGDTIFMQVLDGLRAELARHKLDLVILLGGEDESRLGFLKRVVERGLSDGIIISDTYRQDDRITYLEQRRIPFVSFGRSETPGAHAWVDLDFETVAKESVARLVAKGHTRIGLATLSSQLNYRFIFERAYREAMAAHGIPVDDEIIVYTQGNEAGGYAVGDKLLALDEPPSAVILINENMAQGLYRRLDVSGLRAGPDLAVTGFLERARLKFLSPSLTCFSTDLNGLGRELGTALMAQLPSHGPEEQVERTQKRWPVTLVPGESDAAE